MGSHDQVNSFLGARNDAIGRLDHLLESRALYTDVNSERSTEGDENWRKCIFRQQWSFSSVQYELLDLLWYSGMSTVRQTQSQAQYQDFNTITDQSRSQGLSI